MPIDTQLGFALRDARKDKGMSLSDVAGRLKITIPTLKAYEAGEKTIPPERWTAMKKILPNIDEWTKKTPMDFDARNPLVIMLGGESIRLSAIPRTETALLRLGTGGMRRVLEAINALKSPEVKNEFGRYDSKQRTEFTLRCLREFDSASGKKVDFEMVQAVIDLQNHSEKKFLLRVLEIAERNNLSMKDLRDLILGERKAEG